MSFLTDESLALVAQYGYGIIALAVAIESIGIPFPGETVLIAAAIYGGTTHRLSLAGVVGAAAAGAVVGDNIGFWIGREFGTRLILRHGRLVGLTPPRIKLGQYLFLRHGGKVVFFGRFVALLRTLAAVLAGANRMGWGHFLLCNLAGGVVWAGLYGGLAYWLGEQFRRVLGPVGVVLLRRHERVLEAAAERALPGEPALPGRQR